MIKRKELLDQAVEKATKIQQDFRTYTGYKEYNPASPNKYLNSSMTSLEQRNLRVKVRVQQVKRNSIKLQSSIHYLLDL